MTSSSVSPCNGCGSVVNQEFLFDKPNDGRGNGSISLYRCRMCNTVYLAGFHEIYDDNLYTYYEKYKSKKKEDIYNPITRKSYMKVLQLFEKHGGGKSILDVGCGNGSFVDAALEQGYNAEGIELSKHAVEIAQGFGLPVSCLDFFSNKIQDSSKDIVTMFEVNEHLIEPAKFLRRAETVIKPGGLIYLTTPNFNSLDRRILGNRWGAIHREHLFYFTLKNLLKMINDSTGLEVIHSETRNLSAELINYLKNCGGKVQLQNIYVNSSTETVLIAEPLDLRSKIDQSRLLLSLKHGINKLLNFTSLGSTIIILLRRPKK